MVDVRSHELDIGRLDDGQWAAASCASPFFYFEGATREEVLEDARKALNFYRQVSGHIVPAGETQPATIKRARRTETVRLDDMVAA